jgi:hypothetical protein
MIDLIECVNYLNPVESWDNIWIFEINNGDPYWFCLELEIG